MTRGMVTVCVLARPLTPTSSSKATLTQGVARRIALPWAIFFRAFSPSQSVNCSTIAMTHFRLHMQHNLVLRHARPAPVYFRDLTCAVAGRRRAALPPANPSPQHPSQYSSRLSRNAVAIAPASSGKTAHFSVSQSTPEPVSQYFAGQDEHHLKVGFQDDLRALLQRHEIEWDENYVGE